MASDYNNRRIAKNSILLSVRMVVVIIISLYISRVTLQNLGVEDFGIYNVVCGFVSMFTFLSSAMTSGIQRFYNYEYAKSGEDGANKVFLTSIQSQAILALIIVVLLESIGVWYINNKMVIPDNRFFAAKWIFQISVLSLVISMFKASFDAAIMAHEKMGFYAFLSILNQVLKLTIVMILPLLPGDVLITYGLLFFLVTILDLAISAFYSRIQFKEIRFKKAFERDLFTNMFVFSGWNILGKFALTMKEQGLNMIINLFFGPVINAARALAFQVTSALNGFVSNISVAVKPQLTQSYAHGDRNRTFLLMFANTKIGYLVLFLLALPVSLEIDFLLHLWLGADVPDYTNSFIIIVFFITLLNGMQGNISFVIHANGDMKTYSIITSLVTLLVIPLGYGVLALGFDPNSVFWASLIVTFINYIVSVLILHHIVPFSLTYYFNQVVIPLIIMSMVAIPIPLILHCFIRSSWFRLLIVSIVSVISTTIASYYVALNRDEREFVKKAISMKLPFVFRLYNK